MDLAKLSAIVKIDREDSWLTSNAGYQKPSVVWKNLWEAKPLGVIAMPELQPVKTEYVRVVSNLQKLRKITAPGYQMSKGFFLAALQVAPRLVRGDSIHRKRANHF